MNSWYHEIRPIGTYLECDWLYVMCAMWTVKRLPSLIGWRFPTFITKRTPTLQCHIQWNLLQPVNKGTTTFVIHACSLLSSVRLHYCAVQRQICTILFVIARVCFHVSFNNIMALYSLTSHFSGHAKLIVNRYGSIEMLHHNICCCSGPTSTCWPMVRSSTVLAPCSWLEHYNTSDMHSA